MVEEALIDSFVKVFKKIKKEIKRVKAPGRVNIIGEHTDYNEGFVLPAAIDRHITILGELRSDEILEVYSLDYNQKATFDIKMIEPNREYSWSNYIAGVVKYFQKKGMDIGGMNLLITGNIPQGAGLSSSAALEMATALIINALHPGIKLKEIELIYLCQKVENEFVGVNCGIMDQFISCLGQSGHALFIDCRTLDFEPVPLSNDRVKLVISNTGIKHNLKDSEYNIRFFECKEAALYFSKLTGKDKLSLRDVTIEEFQRYALDLPENLRLRAEHVIFENERVKQGKEFLHKGDLEAFGKLMYQSHASLKDLFKVSCEELNLLVELSRSVKGVYGSRMTGGGFGGCTISLVENEKVEDYIEFVGREYFRQRGIKPEFYICNAVDGTATLKPGF